MWRHNNKDEHRVIDLELGQISVSDKHRLYATESIISLQTKTVPLIEPYKYQNT